MLRSSNGLVIATDAEGRGRQVNTSGLDAVDELKKIAEEDEMTGD